MNKKQYLEYIDHFNNKRYDAVTDYFAPDIAAEFYNNVMNPEKPALKLYGRREFIDFYMNLHEYAREVIELGDFMVSENLLFAELYAEFHCIKNPPPDFRMPLKKKGDVLIRTNWVLYTIESDKFKRIRIAYFKTHDPKLARL